MSCHCSVGMLELLWDVLPVEAGGLGVKSHNNVPFGPVLGMKNETVQTRSDALISELQVARYSFFMPV